MEVIFEDENGESEAFEFPKLFLEWFSMFGDDTDKWKTFINKLDPETRTLHFSFDMNSGIVFNFHFTISVDNVEIDVEELEGE